MARMIDADALITKIKELAKRVQHNPDTCNGLGGAVAIIMEMPTIEERKGRWEWFKKSPTYMRCSACGEAEFRKTKYCPHCGAKMEGAEK